LARTNALAYCNETYFTKKRFYRIIPSSPEIKLIRYDTNLFLRAFTIKLYSCN
jgi:hypothetical protein